MPIGNKKKTNHEKPNNDGAAQRLVIEGRDGPGPDGSGNKQTLPECLPTRPVGDPSSSAPDWYHCVLFCSGPKHPDPAKVGAIFPAVFTAIDDGSSGACNAAATPRFEVKPRPPWMSRGHSPRMSCTMTKPTQGTAMNLLHNTDMVYAVQEVDLALQRVRYREQDP